MTEAARPVRITRRNVAAMQSKENPVLGLKNMLARPSGVRAKLGEIGNRAPSLAVADKAAVKKSGLGAPLQKNSVAAKENVPQEKAKGLALKQPPKSDVLAKKPGAAPLRVSIKPPAVKPAVGILRRVSSLVTVRPMAAALAKPPPAPKAAPKPEEEQPSVPELEGYSTEQIDKLEKFDARDKGDPQSVVDYVREIYDYLKQLEVTFCVPENYIKQSKQMTCHMRGVLMDWLVEVHRQFKLMPETLYLAVAIFDRYMPTAPGTAKQQLQLVGVTCLLVAAKYEEIVCPAVSDCTYITDNTYTRKQVTDMEMRILSALHFNVGRPLPLHFLRRYTKAADASFEEHSMAKYLMELQLVRHEMCHVAPSMQAATALCLSLWVFKDSSGATPISEVWSPQLALFSGYSFAQVEESLRLLAVVVVKGHRSTLTAVRRKFSGKSLMEISKRVEAALPRIKELFP